MKKTLLKIAARLDARVEEFEGYPRTQATDARRDAFIDLSKIVREEAEEMEGGDLSELVSAIVTKQFEELTKPAPKPKTKSKPKGGSK